MKAKLLHCCISLCLLLLVASCQWTRAGDTPSEETALVRRDLSDIRQEGKLRALIAYSATGYFLYRGQPMGYEYEMLTRLAKRLGVELELRVARDLDQMLEILQDGQVDLVAHGLAITEGRKEEVSFSDYLYLTKQVLVQRKPVHWRGMTLDAIHKTRIQDPKDSFGIPLASVKIRLI